jgi:uncharacterized protein YtpQ (UPF0354 family)
MAHDNAVKLFQWRGRVSRKDFRKEFMAAVIAAAPQARCVEVPEDDDLSFRIEGLEEYGQVTISLHRAFAEFEKEPDTRAEILAHWLTSTEHLWQPPRAIDSADVIPTIKDRSWLAAQYAPAEEPPEAGSPRSFWVDDYNDELVVVYAVHRNGFSYTSRSTLLEAGIPAEGIRALALGNLRARTPERSVDAFNGVFVVNAGGNFEASLLLDDSLWSDQRFGGEILLVAVPERDCLIACTESSAQAVWNLASMASHGARTQPYPISSRLFVRARDRFELLDLDEHDDEHPIPALDVIDIEARRDDGTSRFVIVIATPLSPDPRSVFRLFRKIDLLLNHFAATNRVREKTELEINIHAGSDPAIFALLAALPSYVASRGATLFVQRPA